MTRIWRSLPRPARWVGVLWALLILFQRLQVPGMPVALLLPILGVWLALAWYRGVLEIDQHRLLWWLAAFSTIMLLMPLQSAIVDQPVVSLTSLGLVAVIWGAFVFRFRDRSLESYQHALRVLVGITLVLAVLTILFMLTQFAGIAYEDYPAEFFPESVLASQPDFVITYPIVYGSEIMRSNAYLGLEPSFVSAQLGLGLLAAFLTRQRAAVVAVLLLAMVCTVSGSGFAIAGVGAAVLLLHPRRSVFGRYSMALLIGVLALLVTPMGEVLLNRIGETGDSRSSASLRTILPYLQVWPTYIEDIKGVVLGRGPGSSQRLVDSAGILGLLVPTPIKIFFEYGLIGGLLLAAFIIMCCLQGPSRSFAGGLFVSLVTLQPGLATPVITFTLLIFVTLWSPRQDLPLERLRPQARLALIDSKPPVSVPLPQRRPAAGRPTR